MATFRRAFFAYPAEPDDLRQTIELAATQVSTKENALHVDVWPNLNIAGAHIADSVRQSIQKCQFLIADVTRSNPNVYYEIAYALGRGIPVLPVVNISFSGATRELQSDGFFDNVKYETYQNSEELKKLIVDFVGTPLLQIYASDLNLDQPLFLLDTYIKTDFRNGIVSAVKASKVFYRSFDPVETPRFSTIKMIGEATSSVGAVVPFLSSHIDDASRHNLRASFTAGLMQGLGRPLLLIQSGETPVPADYRESIETVQSPDAVTDVVSAFAGEAIKSIQHISKTPVARGRKGPAIQSLWLGASAAENEFRTLEQYFLETSEFIQTLKGVGKIVVGRKGSGKSAIFFMARDVLRRGKGNTVVDLKPESHELLKLRELLETYVSAGVVAHTFSGFWLVLVLTEILLTIKDDAGARSRGDHNALQAVIEIERALDSFSIPTTGDFTSRLSAFVNRVISDVQREAKVSGGKIAADKLTNFVYGGEQKRLRELVAKLAPRGGTIAVLFDNLDKGWPATGVRGADVQFLRSLIEALNRIQRDLSPLGVDFRFSVFLRNDVYELLVAETTDRGKEGAIRIDWNDREKLRLVIGKRISASSNVKLSALASWQLHFPATVHGKDGLDYAIDHSLMRPRFLIDIIERAISFAINREHAKVSEADLVDAVKQHSHYLVADFGYEIRDASSMTNEIIDAFLGSDRTLTADGVRDRLSSIFLDDEQIARARFLLVWYGFLGVVSADGMDRYIYDFEYSVRRMEAEIKHAGAGVQFVINPAFYVGLQ